MYVLFGLHKRNELDLSELRRRTRPTPATKGGCCRINMTTPIEQTERTRIRRLPKRGVYDRETIYSILDEALICHVGFAIDGKPFVIPTGFARIDDTLIIHGSSASRMLRNIAEGVDVCVTVTLLDGLVLARSAFHHSMNYRSVVIFGKADLVEDGDAKLKALEAFTEHVVPGRWKDVRWPSDLELKATTVLSLPIDEASAKVRTGGPIDDDEDYEMDVWAGVLPLDLGPGAPIADDRNKAAIIPKNVLEYRRRID
jgi:nitroimidazol reductase NimA-like FMN-containing flavoprotein (pyridoxamine 5'-phosphate oxidase superfamily)